MKWFLLMLIPAMTAIGETVVRDEGEDDLHVKRVVDIDPTDFSFPALERRALAEIQQNREFRIRRTIFQIGREDSPPKLPHMDFANWRRNYDFQLGLKVGIAELTVIDGNAI